MCNLSDMLVEENLEKGVKATKMILAGKSDEEIMKSTDSHISKEVKLHRVSDWYHKRNLL